VIKFGPGGDSRKVISCVQRDKKVGDDDRNQTRLSHQLQKLGLGGGDYKEIVPDYSSDIAFCCLHTTQTANSILEHQVSAVANWSKQKTCSEFSIVVFDTNDVDELGMHEHFNDDNPDSQQQRRQQQQQREREREREQQREHFGFVN